MRFSGRLAHLFVGLGATFLAREAHAQVITAQGPVTAMTNVNQFRGAVDTATFDEGGSLNANSHLALGLRWQSGAFSSILPGIVSTGNAVFGFGTGLSSFPAPIGGGGNAAGSATLLTGVATFTKPITQVGLTASQNGTQYLTAWRANGALIGQVTYNPQSRAAFVGIDTRGVPIAMVSFGNDDVFGGAAYDVGGTTNISDEWKWASGNCSSAAECNDGLPCTDDACNVMTGQCSNTPKVCMASDNCHLAGVCNPMDGVCSNPAKNNGEACSDSNLCTQTDTCQAGVCTGANPVVCAAPDQCHEPGTCNTATGMCTYVDKANGTACNDGNACTQADTCQAGACTGSNPVSCTASDECHTAGMCDTTTGMCSNPAKADGSACTDGTCTAGACVPTPGGGSSSGGASSSTSSSGGMMMTNPDGTVSLNGPSGAGCGCTTTNQSGWNFAALGAGIALFQGFARRLRSRRRR